MKSWEMIKKAMKEPSAGEQCHAGILNVITDAKNKGSLWADTALGELCLLTGKNYQFTRRTALDFERHEIEVK